MALTRFSRCTDLRTHTPEDSTVLMAEAQKNYHVFVQIRHTVGTTHT